MTADTLERPRARKAAVPARQTAVATIDKIGPFPEAYGRKMVVDHQGVLWPHASTGDVLDIDFDCHAYTGEGLYLMHIDEAPWGWTGGRVLSMAPDLQIREMTLDRGWQWRPWTDTERAKTRILGKVHDVYRKQKCSAPGCNIVGTLMAVGGQDGCGSATFAVHNDRLITLTGLSRHELANLTGALMEPMRIEVSTTPDTLFGPGVR
jgi:hypothetical protein